ncbi:uncharacterized protein LOC111430946 isoform X3 [Cucurbita moschata]|uniref:Uncharacterized protein LOC111430946 isoform X3 n=1 Tax=Cucurbita moschata TaxID=3662 RepID=A0A6J1E5G0_CUCMO|nr:uncharacterized protein LOC111430946 isoform X3 [Cucurbita moschata]
MSICESIMMHKEIDWKFMEPSDYGAVNRLQMQLIVRETYLLFLKSWAYQFQGDFFGKIAAVTRGCRPWSCGFHLSTVIITAQFG